MITYIIGAGYTDIDFVRSVLEHNAEEESYIIAADRGVDTCIKLGICPNYIIGDFDSAGEGLYQEACKMGAPLKKLNPVKDDSDSEAALSVAFLNTQGPIYFLCGTGSRLDHVLGNISILGQGIANNRRVVLMDSTNKIQMIFGGEKVEIPKDKQHGKYVSVFPYMGKVVGLTMKGFKYPLDKYELGGFTTLTVSNEITAKIGEISIDEGYLIVMETRD